jgi:hypothetical protein
VVIEGSPERRVNERSDGGRFVVQGVLPGLVRLRVEAPGYASETVSLQVTEPDRARGGGGTLPVVALQRAGIIEGQVSEMTGQAVIGATASVGRLTTVTGPTGGFKIDRVPEGNHVVEVRHRDGRVVRSDPVVVRAEQVSGPIRLLLR